MDIHAGLFKLYISRLDEFKLVKRKSSGILNGPFLSSPGKKYSDAMTKIVFIGQETNGWASNFDVEAQMREYIDFGLGVNYFSSPFWNVIRKVEKEIAGDYYCSAWLNLNKFDENNKSPSPSNLAILEKLDNILLMEIELLSPDIVVLFTGPRYDSRVTRIFNQELQEFVGFNIRQLAEIQMIDQPYKVYRTYHPNYLRRSGLENRVIQAISTRGSL